MLTLALVLFADPLPVPADALAVVQVRGLGHVRRQLVGLATAVAPGKATEFTARLDDLLKPDGRELFALDVSRRSYFAILPAGTDVTWAVWLPTTDYARFRAEVLTADERAALQPGLGYDTTAFAGRPLYLLDHTATGFVVATPSEAVAKRLAGASRPLVIDAVGEASGVFLGSDLGLFVNLPAVQARYGGLLAGTRFALPTMLASGTFGLPKLDARQAGQIATVADGVIQSVADGSGFAVGVSVGPAGVTVDSALAVRPGTASAKVLAGERPHPMPLLDAMPGGQSAYAAGRFGAELAKRFRVAFPEVVGAENGAAYAEHGWATAGADPGPVLEVCRPLDPNQWRAALRAAYERAGPGTAVQNVPLKERPALVRQAVEHRGRAFDRLALTFDLPSATAAIADDGIRQAAHVTMKSLVGERSEQWLTADAAHGLRLTAADWPAACGLMDTFLGDGAKACDDAAVTAIRRRLPAEASAVVLLDAAAFTCKVGELARGAVEELPAFPGLELPAFVPHARRSPFLGMAVVTHPTGGRAILVLPAEAIKASAAAVRIDP